MQAPKRARSAKRDGAHKRPAKAGGRRGRQTGYHQGLTRDGIATAALALIDREGLDALTYRRLAETIGCEAMSLYHYFPSKAHLIDAVLDRVFGALEIPPPGGDWLERVRKAAWNYRAMALAHPKLYPLLAVHRLNTTVGVRKLDEIIGLFRDGGFDDATAARLFREVGYYLTGAALDETAGYAQGPSAAEPVTDAEVARDCPNLAAVAPYFKPRYFERTFTDGLEMLLQNMMRLRSKA
jgi:AcrR family transcriptional regulator